MHRFFQPTTTHHKYCRYESPTLLHIAAPSAENLNSLVAAVSTFFHITRPHPFETKAPSTARTELARNHEAQQHNGRSLPHQPVCRLPNFIQPHLRPLRKLRLPRCQEALFRLQDRREAQDRLRRLLLQSDLQRCALEGPQDRVQGVRALRRASFIFTALFHLFLLENRSSAVSHGTIGQGGLMTLHFDYEETDRRAHLGLPIIRPFPAHFAAGGHALAVLCNERCGEVLGLARPLFDQVMRRE